MKKNFSKEEQIAFWLYICSLLVICMIFIGGITRLTNSGLSIVEWKPVTGIVPPLNTEEWAGELSKYQTSPEYKKINYNITLEEFKNIYLIEYFHRLMGRITGIVFFIPFIYFYRNLNNNLKRNLFLALFLGFIQGCMGWYMVKSGLKDAPHVSHYRLAFHLIIAVLIYIILFSSAIRESSYKLCFPQKLNKKWLSCILTMIVIQIFSGGLVAGLNGGQIYNSFPLMNGHVIPPEILFYKPWYINFFENAATVQFTHRMIAYFITLNIIAFIIYYRKYRNIALILGIPLILQISLGILTLINSVPIILASLHQIGSIILLSSTIYLKANHEN